MHQIDQAPDQRRRRRARRSTTPFQRSMIRPVWSVMPSSDGSQPRFTCVGAAGQRQRRGDCERAGTRPPGRGHAARGLLVRTQRRPSARSVDRCAAPRPTPCPGRQRSTWHAIGDESRATACKPYSRTPRCHAVRVGRVATRVDGAPTDPSRGRPAAGSYPDARYSTPPPCAPAPGRARGAAGRAGRRLGRPAPAARRGPPGPAAARRRPRGDRGRRSARGPRRSASPARTSVAVHAAVLGGAARAGGARRRGGARPRSSTPPCCTRRRTAASRRRAGAGRPAGRVDLDAFVGGRRGHGDGARRACRAPTARSAPGSRSTAVAAGGAGRPASRCWSTPRRRSGTTAPPAAWDVLVADPRAWGAPAGARRARRPRAAPAGCAGRAGARRHSSGSPGEVVVPAALAAAVAPAGGDRRARAEDARRRTRWSTGSARRPRPRAGRRGRGRPGRPAAARRDVLLPLRRRRGAASASSTGAGFAVGSGSACTAATLRAEPRAGRDGRADARQRARRRCRSASPAADGATRSAPRCRARWRGSARCSGRPTCDADRAVTRRARRRPRAVAGGRRRRRRVDATGLRCPLPVIRLAPRPGTAAPGHRDRAAQHRPGGRARRRRRGAGCAGHDLLEPARPGRHGCRVLVRAGSGCPERPAERGAGQRRARGGGRYSRPADLDHAEASPGARCATARRAAGAASPSSAQHADQRRPGRPWTRRSRGGTSTPPRTARRCATP